MTARECLDKKHWVTHLSKENYVCWTCSDYNKKGINHHRVEPAAEWLNHEHMWVWWGHDGIDNYQHCTVCGLNSHDDKAFSAHRAKYEALGQVCDHCGMVQPGTGPLKPGTKHGTERPRLCDKCREPETIKP